GGQQFANGGVPQIGPGVGSAAPLDIGQAEQLPQPQQLFARFVFKVPPLRNVELTGPYMHDGAYPTLDAVLRHYTNADSALENFDVSQLPAAVRPYYHGDATTIAEVRATLDGRLQLGIPLTGIERAEIIAFLKSLTDPAARDLSS